MGYAHHPDDLSFNQVSDKERENLEIHSTIIFTQARERRILRDPA
jgi:hypothetical protein